ncbi:MAG: hypothetical protein ACI4HQ_11245 [Acetatifactor sp.]
MEQNMEYRQQQAQNYKQIVMPLLRYLPWLEQKCGQQVSSFYRGPEFTEHSMSIPVFDGTLLNFIREAEGSALMDRNYCYVYTRNRIKTHDDERRVIESADIQDWDTLRGILSNYVLGGRTKSALWSQAMQENIFLLVLKKMKQIIEYWDKPFEV